MIVPAPSVITNADTREYATTAPTTEPITAPSMIVKTMPSSEASPQVAIDTTAKAPSSWTLYPIERSKSPMIMGTVSTPAITMTTLPRLKIDCQLPQVANVSGRATEKTSTTMPNATSVP